MLPGISRRKLCISAAIYFSNFGYGCVSNFISPLVIAFSKKFHTDVQSVSVIFTVLTTSYLISALSSAFLYRHVNRHAFVIFLLSMVSVAVFVMPHVTSLYLFYFLGFIMGYGGGGCDTALITWIIELWRQQAAPFILTQHFSYSIGTIVPPLLLAPFLGDNRKSILMSNSTSTDTNNSTFSTSQEDFVNLSIPFGIGGSLLMSTAICHLILVFYLKKTAENIAPDRESLLESNPTLNSSQQIQPNGNDSDGPLTRRTLTLVLLSCSIIGFYQALEMTTMQFFPTFCVYSKLGLSQAAGAKILFGLSLAFSLGRGLGILLVLKIPPQIILWSNFSMILVANLILYKIGQSSLSYLWIGALLLGAGMSTVYPSFYAYIERHVHITNGIVAAITVSGGGVSAIYPLIVGNFVKENPSVLNYVTFFSLAVIVISFGVTHWITRGPKISLEPLK